MISTVKFIAVAESIDLGSKRDVVCAQIAKFFMEQQSTKPDIVMNE